ncbi:hypothetical protein V6Z11_A08G134600 [Gossypium hirsutum]
MRLRRLQDSLFGKVQLAILKSLWLDRIPFVSPDFAEDWGLDTFRIRIIHSLWRLGLTLSLVRMLYGYEFFAQNMGGKISFLILFIEVTAPIYGDLSLRCGPFFVRILCGQ